MTGRFTPWTRASGPRLLVVDADGERISQELSSAGMQVTWCAKGSDALVSYGRLEPDAVLLCPRLPDLSAREVVQTVRRFGTQPILLGVAPADADVAGPIFVAGATAAVARPYVAQEVALRIAGELPELSARTQLSFGPLTLDPGAHTVHLAGKELHGVPLKEFELLRLLMTHADRVVSQAQIRSALWSGADSAPSPNAITVHAARLRSRLQEPVVLRTVRGLGYRLTMLN